MTTQIIAISDIHISSSNAGEIMERLSRVAQIVGTREMSISKLIVLCTGDIAFSGCKEEYESFIASWEIFVEECRKKIKGLDVSFYCVPGNHDVNFKEDEGVCDALKEGSDQYRKFESFFIKRQKAFYEAQSKLNTNVDFKSTLFQRIVIDVQHPPYKIELLMYNSSRYMTRNQERGTYEYIEERLEEVPEASPRLKISMMHHPLDYFNVRDRAKLETLLERESHIVLTGHDHGGKSYGYATNDRMFQKIELPVFYDDNETTKCGLYSMYIDWQEDDGKLLIRKLMYQLEDGNKFVLKESDTIEIPLCDIANVVNFSNRHIDRLTRSYAPFDYDGFKLSNVEQFYIFPFLKKRIQERTICVNSKELLKSLGAECRIIVYGDTMSGKTMLAKQVVLSLSRQGVLPVYIDCSSEKGHSIIQLIDRAYKEQYGQQDEYLNLPPSKLAVVFDNIHELKLPRKTVGEILKELDRRIDKIIIFSGEQLSMLQSTDSALLEEIVDAYDCYDIMPFNHLQRLQMIGKWADYHYSSIQEQERDALIADSERKLEALLGRSLVPKYPFYIGLMLQAIAMTKENVSQRQVGTYGGLYDLVMRLQLCRISDKTLELNTYINYLSIAAFQLYKSGKRSFSHDEYKSFHAQYEKVYGFNFSQTRIYNSLLEIGIFDEEKLPSGNVRISFRLPYTFYYFVACYLSRNIEKEDVKSKVCEILDSIFRREESHIWIFLTHLSPNRFIIQTLIDRAKSKLQDYAQIDLATDMKLLWGDMSPDMRLKFNDRPYNELSEDRARMADAIEENYPEPQINDGDLPEAQLYASIKLIDISGQLLRNFIGTTELKDKVQLLVESYSLALRSITYFVAIFKKSVTEYFSKMDNPDVSQDDKGGEREKEMLRKAYPLVQMYTYGVLHALALSVAHKDLSLAYDEAKDSMLASVSSDFLDVVVRLFSLDEYEELIDFGTNSKRYKTLFVKQLASMAGFVYCYMTPIDSSKKQRICKKLGIDFSSMQLLERRIR